MPNEATRVYWDSNVYISLIEETPGRIDVLRAIHQQAERGEIVFVASAFVIAEVTKINRVDKSVASQVKMIQDYFENPFISIRSLDRKTAEWAAEISRDFPDIRPPDAVHVATALRWKCNCLHTYDGEAGGPTKLLAYNGRIGSPPLRIVLPAVLDRPKTQPTLPGI